MRLLAFVCIVLGAAAASIAQNVSRHVLIVGVDGTRFDALQKAKTPNFDRLIADGALSDNCSILGERYRKNDTVSGPGWSTILTGVWADKHGVHDNKFETPNFKEYPHFFRRLKQQFPAARTVSLDSWAPIKQYVVSDADVAESLDSDKGTKEELDNRMAARAAAVLKSPAEPPTAMFVYIHQVDSAGHNRGFHPTVPSYIRAIENADRNVGEIIAALESRKTVAKEDWLVIICTDHGGRGTGHGGGHEYPEVTQTFLIAWSNRRKLGIELPPTELVDVAPTALVHLGVSLEPEWKLDGKPLDLRPSAQPAE